MAETFKILIIDDSEDDRMLYRRTLQKSPEITYSITEAESGEEGLASIAGEQPDCILLDYSLPGHNGIDVLKQVRAKYPFLPVVMLTGQGNENVAVAAMQEGAQNYISKSSITVEAMQRITSSAIDHCALHERIHDQRASLEIFSRALAHDLKEPVRTIRSFLDLLVPHQGFSDKEKNYFRYIQNAALRMNDLIETVFFYTQLDGGQKEIRREECDVGKALQEVQENIGALVRQSGAAITSETLPRVMANRAQLGQVIQNLLCNAIRHSDKPPVIHVCAQKQGSQWRFSISDNGRGIAPEDRERIFEPFKRLAHDKEPGLGLGLAICKKIVESHGGKIGCTQETSSGTTFFFTLPDTPALAAEQKQPSQDAAPAPKAVRDANGKTLANLLLVEDNQADIELARIMLVEEGGLQSTFMVAHDAYEAMRIMPAENEKGHGIDLMLLDINMPGMNGFELLKFMQTNETLRHIPVVMCTTSNDARDMEKAKALGAKGYMVKPAEMDKLIPMIDAISSLRLSHENTNYVLSRAG